MLSTTSWRALVVVLLFAGCKGESYEARLSTGDTVKFIRAIKGNDVVVEREGKLARVRLVGVYAFDPNVSEKKEILALARGGVDAIGARTRDKPLKIVLELQELDPKGRHLGFLESDGVDVARSLIEDGTLAVYTEYPFSREADYIAMENGARAAGKGVWGATTSPKRLRALRETWASVRTRRSGAGPADPLLAAQAN
jgi:endonuclease YncB( thermonuclease family)